MSLPETPSNADSSELSRRDRKARHAPTTYTTPIIHYADDKTDDATPITLAHPYFKTVGLRTLLKRYRLRREEIRRGLPPHDLLTGKIIYNGENAQLSHLAHQHLEFLEFFRMSEVTGVKYLNPHSTGNVLESLVENHNPYNLFLDILLPLQEDLDRFAAYLTESLDSIKHGKTPTCIFDVEGFSKDRVWTYEFTCAGRKTPLHVLFRDDGSLILDQIADAGRHIAMPAHGYLIRNIAAHFAFVFLGSACGINHHSHPDRQSKFEKILSPSQASRVALIRRLSNDIGLFRPMTAEEYRKLKVIGLAPTDQQLFKKLTRGRRMWLVEDDYRVEVKFDPAWRPEVEQVGPAGTPLIAGSSSPAASEFDETSVEYDDPRDDYGRARSRRYKSVPKPPRFPYTPSATLDKQRQQRENRKAAKKEQVKTQTEHPGAQTKHTETQTALKRLRLNSPLEDDAAPADSDDSGGKPRKKARIAQRSTIAPARKTADTARRLVRARQPLAPAVAQQVPTTQPVAGPGPRTLANRFPAAMQEPQTFPSQPVVRPGPMPAAGSTRTRRTLPAPAMQEPQAPPSHSQSIANPGPVAAAKSHSTRTQRTFPAAMQEPQSPPSQPVAGPGPRTTANQYRNTQTERRTVTGSRLHGLTEPTIASRARARTPAESQPFRTSGPAPPNFKRNSAKAKDVDKDKDKSTRR
ncbi:hypothetical protein CYLTODRAFT_494123 [Cylindrobasidium torrendii FP15055 ss-10]|uniref:Uncharacterized protein n=1 Tax=Cylindrobasidium torrendii FP15055 ss-10 TaxID=1314674 RepID=A0A0D7AZ67_9AGAR|nr:hypothetical protein CYLTODRAFT_494123 [Cylindrobasidium torrendii FP15055 ss-10]